MGPAQREAIQLANVGPYERLAMDSLPYEGMSSTNSADPETFVTDSAAGATSMASGVKTYNGAIGLDADKNVVPTILEQAKASGKATGIVTTSQVTDATGAAFGAHVEDRDQQTEIARQFIEDTGVDVILGGGEDYWYPEGEPGAYPNDPEAEEESVSDQGDLVARAEELGYEYAADSGGLQGASGPKLLGLFANQTMFSAEPEGEGDSYDPNVPLPEMTAKAVDTLSQNEEGFFLVVEEEATDEMGHSNNSGLTIESGRALDQTVADTRQFAEASGETLMITTADHETGGLTIEELDSEEYPDENGGNEDDENANLSTEDGPFDIANSDYQFIMDWTTTGHTGVDVPLTALGPGAENLTGNYENTHIYEVMADSLGVAGIDPAASGAQNDGLPKTGGPGSGLASYPLFLTVLAGALGVGGLLLLLRKKLR